MKSKIKQHYHWILAVILLIELAIYGGLINNNSSLYIIPVTEALGISRGSFSLAVSASNIVGFVCLLFSGVFVSKLGSRKMLISGLGLATIAYIIASQSQSIASIVIASVFLGVCNSLCASAAVTRVISDWFHRYQGTVLGVVSASTGFGGSLMCMILTAVMSYSDWRASYIASALMVLFAGVLVFLFVRSRPSDMGLQPYGYGYAPKKMKKQNTDSNWPGYTMQELTRRPSFYLLLLVTFLSNICVYFAFSVIVPHLRDSGLNATEASSLQSTMLILLAVSKIIYGFLCDRIGPKRVTIISMVFAVVSLWTLTGVSNYTSAIITIVLYSFALPIVTILPPLLAHDLFGYRSHSSSLGIIMAMTSLGSLLANPISNMVFDHVGSYNPVFRFGAVMATVAIMLSFLLFLLAKKDRQNYKENPAPQTEV